MRGRVACRRQVQQYPFTDSQLVQLPDWQLFLQATAQDVLQEQSPKQLLKARQPLPVHHLHSSPLMHTAARRTRRQRRTAAVAAEPHPRAPRPQVRGRLYELLSSCIPAETVMVYLVRELMGKVAPPVRLETLHYAAIYEHRMQQGQKPIFHLEAFLARFMAIYKKHAVQTFA